ncbi:MAG: ABC transporter ATP-binding protein [Pseudomonadota bacterium]
MSAPGAVTLAGIAHRFGGATALTGVDLGIAAGEYVTLLGPSGCGKTTLLNVLGGFLRPDAGSVRIGAEDVTDRPAARRPTATVFQDYALFPHMTLAENVAFGLRMAGMGRGARRARAEEMLALVGLGGLGANRPHMLSGGQRQRVALARALAVQPAVLLLDEPLGALDLKLRRAMQDELKTIHRQLGTTFVHVTHDQEEAMAIADRIVVMNAGQIEDDGPPERVYRQPATLFAAGFMGEMNRISGEAQGGKLETAFGVVPADGAGRHVLCLRPEAIGPGRTGLQIGPAKVRDAAFFGTYIRAHLEPRAAPGLVLVAHLPPGPVPAEGAEMDLGADMSDLNIYREP